MEQREIIRPVSSKISNKLHKEIMYAYENLNSVEKQKTQGKKKRKFTMLEASHELGKYLYEKRKNNKHNEISMQFDISLKR